MSPNTQSLQQLIAKYSKPNNNHKNLYNKSVGKKPAVDPTDVLVVMIDTLIDEYKSNPNVTLQVCHQAFGRERVQNAMRRYIHQHTAKVAFCLAMRQIFQQEVASETNTRIA